MVKTHLQPAPTIDTVKKLRHNSILHNGLLRGMIRFCDGAKLIFNL